MRSFERASAASPEAAWSLLASPSRWHEWAPHVRGAWGLGSPHVREGARGFVRLAGVLPVPARIVSVDPGREWTWEVAGVTRMSHRVEPASGGCTVAIDLAAPGPLEPALATAYGPVIRWALGRLAERAAA